MQTPGLVVLVSVFAFTPLLVAQSAAVPGVAIAGPGSGFGVGQPGDRMRYNFDLVTVSGTLLGRDGYPIQNGEIRLQSLTDGALLATTTSSIAGSFELRDIPPGDYELEADKGTAQGFARLHCTQGFNTVTVHIDMAGAPSPAGGDTVSVAALSVPRKAHDLFEKANKAFQKNNLQESWTLTEKALAAAPSYAEALTLHGILCVEKGDLAGGESSLQAAIKNDSNYPLAYFAMGTLQNIQGRYADAQHTLEQGLRVQPNSWQGYFELSKSMLGQSDYRNALRDVVRAENMGVNYAPMYLVKAHALMGLKYYSEAAKEFEHFLQLDPAGPNSANARKSLEAAKSFAQTAEN